MNYKVDKTDAEWRAQLTPEQYNVTREKGTERAFTGIYHDCKTPGVYRCVCCDAELFDANTKFDSGTGWPSFWAPANEENVATEIDRSWFMRRTEVYCQPVWRPSGTRVRGWSRADRHALLHQFGGIKVGT